MEDFRKLIAFLSVLKQGLEMVGQCRIIPVQGAESPEDFYRQVHSRDPALLRAPPSQSTDGIASPGHVHCPGNHISN